MGEKFKGRAILSGSLKGEALVSKQAFNLTGSYMENMFAGRTDSAPCTDSSNKELVGKNLAGAIICTSQTVGSTFGSAAVMGMNAIGIGPKAYLFAWHIDSISAGGLIMDDIWNGRRVITIDLLGDEFLEKVQMGDPITIYEDGTVEVG